MNCGFSTALDCKRPDGVVRDKEAMWHLPAEVSEAPSALMVRSRLDRKSQEDHKCTVECNDVRV